jgi:hypothetical protein
VAFYDGGVSLGTGTVSGGTTATFTTSNLTIGSHSITATYSSDGNFLGSTAAALTQTVNQTLTTTLVSYYAMDATQTADSSPNALNLTNSGATVVGGYVRAPTAGANASRFSGTSQYMVSPIDGRYQATNSLTLACWFRVLAAGTYAVMAKRGAATNEYECIVLDSGAQIYFTVGGGATPVISGFHATVGRYYFLVCTWDQTTNTAGISLDGAAPVTATGPAPPIASSIPLTLGADLQGAGNTPGAVLNGDIDEVGCWDRVLSTQEIAALYNLGHGTTYPFSAPPAWTPAAIPNQLVWLQASTAVYKDAALTVPATLNNDPVLGWKDQSGAARNVTGGTAGITLAVPGAGVSGPAVKFPATTATLTTALTFASAPLSIVLIGTIPNITTPTQAEMIGMVVTGGMAMDFTNTNGIVGRHGVGWDVTNNLAPALAANTPFIAIARTDGTNISIRVNRINSTVAAPSPSNLAATLQMLGNALGMQVLELIAYGSSLTDVLCQHLEAYSKNTYGTP